MSHWVNYFSFSSLLLLRTSSHIWGRWYLPMFLFRDGPLTLMYMDSLISLERFCSSLSTTLKLSSEVVWPEVLLWSCMGEGGPPHPYMTIVTPQVTLPHLIWVRGSPSPIHDHSNTSGHTTTLDNFKVVDREEQNLSRLIKESMYIRVNGPSLNKNIGKYHLPHMWDEVLNNSRELKLK